MPHLSKSQSEMFIPLFEGGITTEFLEAEIKGLVPSLEGELLQLERMSLVAFMRQAGYVIPRKRGWYQITGKEEIKVEPTLKDWDPERQKTIKEIEKFPLTIHSWREVGAYTNTWDSEGVDHNLSSTVLLSYYGAHHSKLYWVQADETCLLVQKKFTDLPSLSLLVPNPTTVNGLKTWVPRLVNASHRDLKVVSPWGDLEDVLIELEFEKYGRSAQSVYDVEYLSEDSIGDHSHGTRNQIKKNLKELRIEEIGEHNRKDANLVVDLWKMGPAGLKQRQLSITRDYIAIDMSATLGENIGLLFYRNDQPVGVEIYDYLPSHGWVAHVVSKALNYTSQPGGYGSTSVSCMILGARYLKTKGVTTINGGDIGGGTIGLEKHKIELMKKSKTEPVYSTTWTVRRGSSLRRRD
jgi:hypothetical protein